MPRVIAITETRYASKTYLPDDDFEVSESDAVVLKAIGKVRDAPVRRQPVVSKPVPAPVPEQKVEVPISTVDSSVESTAPTRRRYLRRDLRSQE